MNKPRGDNAAREQTPTQAKQLAMDNLRDRMPACDWDQVLQEIYEARRERV